ncbi:hypothetical protein ACVU02_000591 [Listeria monocytogenes]
MDLNKEIKYVCYERTYHYFLKKYMEIKSPDIFYIDRFLGFKFNFDNPEPLFPSSNLLEEMMRDKCINIEVVEFNDLINMLFGRLETSVAKVGMSMLNAQNEEYFTSVLLEKIDSDYVFYTKISETARDIEKPLPIEEFLERIYIEDNKVEIEWLSYDSPIDTLLWFEKGKEKYANLQYVNEFEEFILSQKSFYCNVENQQNLKCDKKLQLRFSKHVLNKLYPLVFFLEEEFISSNENDLVLAGIKLEQSLNKFQKVSSIILSLGDFQYFEAYIEMLYEINCHLKKLYEKILGEIL